MKTAELIVVAALIASPAYAQTERSAAASGDERGYVLGTGGFNTSTTAVAGTSLLSASGAAQGGVRVAKHVQLFGEVGRFKDLEPASVQPSVDTAVAAFSSNLGLDVVGTSTMPAWYGIGGVRV